MISFKVNYHKVSDATKSKCDVDNDSSNTDKSRRKGIIDSTRIYDVALPSCSKGVKRRLDDDDNNPSSAKKCKPENTLTAQPTISAFPKLDSDFLNAFKLKSSYSQLELVKVTKLSLYSVHKMVAKYCVEVDPNNKRSKLQLTSSAKQILIEIPSSSNVISLPPLSPNSQLLLGLEMSSSSEDEGNIDGSSSSFAPKDSFSKPKLINVPAAGNEPTNEKCPVCMEPIGQRPFIPCLCCKQRFCVHCMAVWSRHNVDSPLCRAGTMQRERISSITNNNNNTPPANIAAVLKRMRKNPPKGTPPVRRKKKEHIRDMVWRCYYKRRE
jgi:hypothetical protein